MQHMLEVQWYFILIPWKGNGSFAHPVLWPLCQPHPRTHHSMASHWSSIIQSGRNRDKQSKIKFLLCDKWHYLNCSSYIFHDILRLILQQRPKQFGLLTALVARATHLFCLYCKDSRVTQTSFYMAQLLKAVSSGFGGSGDTHSPRRECVCVCVQPICKNCKGAWCPVLQRCSYFWK